MAAAPAARRRRGLLLRALLVLLLAAALPPSAAKKKGRAGRKKAGMRKGARPDAAQLSQLVQQGMQLAAAGKTREAERQLATVLEHDPANYQALGNRANLLPELGRAAEGVAALETAARLYPTDPTVPCKCSSSLCGVLVFKEAAAQTTWGRCRPTSATTPKRWSSSPRRLR